MRSNNQKSTNTELTSHLNSEVGLFKTPQNERYQHLPEVLDGVIFNYFGLHEMIALSITNKASRKLILILAENILIRYFQKRRNGNPLKVIPVSFKSNPIDVASQLLSTSVLRNKANLTGHLHSITSATFSPDGHYFVTEGFTEHAELWSQDVNGMWQSVVLREHTSYITDISFSPDGRYFVTGSYDKTCRVWRRDNNRQWQQGVLRGHTSSIYAITFSPDGNLFVTGSKYGICRVWSRDDNGLRRSVVLQGHTDMINAISFSPDGRYFVTGSYDRTCRVWRRDNNGQWQSKVLRGHTGGVTAIRFSPDGRYFVSLLDDLTSKIWQRDPYDVWQAQDDVEQNDSTVYVNRLLDIFKTSSSFGMNLLISFLFFTACYSLYRITTPEVEDRQLHQTCSI
jgi:WD40 repeat protein